MAPGQPGGDGGVEFIQVPSEKMVGLSHNNQPVFSGQRRDGLLHFFSFAEFVVGAVKEELRLGTIRQEREIRAVHRDADPDEFADTCIAATYAKTHKTPKAEAREEQRDARKLCSEIIERGLHVALLAASFVVFTRAQACAAKIEAQHRDAQGVQRFRRVINHLVVHGTAEKRVGMANHRREQGWNGLRGSPEYGLEAAGGAFEEKVLRIVDGLHVRNSQQKCTRNETFGRIV
jgi:hypothetical protein